MENSNESLQKNIRYTWVRLQQCTLLNLRGWIPVKMLQTSVHYRCVCVCVCVLDGPVGDPVRHRPLAPGGGALLCGGGDWGGHPELRKVCPQPLGRGKEPCASSLGGGLLCQIDAHRFQERGREAAPYQLQSSVYRDGDKAQRRSDLLTVQCRLVHKKKQLMPQFEWCVFL